MISSLCVASLNFGIFSFMYIRPKPSQKCSLSTVLYAPEEEVLTEDLHPYSVTSQVLAQR
jgi:hypothetical protein